MTDSTAWHELPAAVRDAIQEHTGPVTAASAASDGDSTAVRLILHTAAGRVFIKGTGPGPDSPILAHQRKRLAIGAAIAAHVTALSPPLLFRTETAGWDITGWPALPGRPRADLTPGTSDLPLISGLLATLARMPAPATLTMNARDDWGRWTDSPGLLDGDMLVHSDPRPENFVVDKDRAWLVDWGWALRGPAWLTPALLILSMTESGWEPAAAEEALADLPGWSGAPRRAVGAFAAANAAMWDQAAQRAPTGIRKAKRDAARAWADHRAALTS